MIFNENDDLLFADDDEVMFEDIVEEEDIETDYWDIVVADDDDEVHAVTKMVLKDYEFEGRKLRLISARSGEEAKEVIKNNPDTAVILLDVVMEEDDSGLSVVRYIREELKNKFVRIILRTGNPGQAPEEEVIKLYDINDYKVKTELTIQKLYTVITTALRTYRDIRTIDKNRKGLELIINSSSDFYKLQSLKKFVEGVLIQLTSLLEIESSSIYMQSSGMVLTKAQEDFVVIAGTGIYEKYIDKNIGQLSKQDFSKDIMRSFGENRDLFHENIYIGYFKTLNGSENVLYMKGKKNFTELDRNLIRIFSSNVSIALDNIYLNKDIIDTQKEVIMTLGEVVETRSKETANHVLRVAKFAKFISMKLGYSENESEILKLAAPMHDVGKIAIPDDILNKPGRLTEEEFEKIKSHTTIGYEILKKSNRVILKTASDIALGHHERWDGKGYPRKLKGEEIDINSRIIALCDVFDALSHKRVYKDAWSLEKIIEYFKEQSGKHFDPNIVKIFLQNLDTFIEINKMYPDKVKKE